MKECVMGKFKVLEVKQNIELFQVIEEIQTNLSNLKVAPAGQFNLEHIKKSLQIYLNKYNGEYQLEGAYIQISGKKLALYYKGGYDRQDVTNDFFSPNGIFVKQLIDEYIEYYQDYLIVTINDMLKEKGQKELSKFTIFKLFSAYLPVKKLDFYQSTEGESAGANPITTYIYKFKNVINNNQFTLKAIDKSTAKGRTKEEAGHDTNDIKEAAPIIIALTELGMDVNAEELGLDKKQIEVLKKQFTNWTEKDKKERSLKEKQKYYLYHSQATTLSEIIKHNLAFKTILRGKNAIYNNIRNTGINLYKEDTGKTLSIDKYTPADFIMVQSISIPKKKDIIQYNNLFANDLLHTSGNIKKVSTGFKFIGVSQKEDAGARGGRGKELFTVLQSEKYGDIKWGFDFPPTVNKIDEIYQELNKKLKKYNFISLEENNTFIQNNTKQKYSILKILEGLVTNNKKNKTISAESFLEMVKFSMSAWDGLNPCFYKVIGEQIEAFNNERFEISLNLSGTSKIVIRYTEKSAVLIIPVFISMDTGEGFLSHKMYSIKLPFEVSAKGISPNIQSIEEIEQEGEKEENRITSKVIVEAEIGIDKNRPSIILKNMGYKPEEIERLSIILKNESWKTWFKEYKRLVYKWIIKHLDKINGEELRKEIQTKINMDLKDLEMGIGSAAENSHKYQHIRNLLLSDDSGVSYEKATNKYIFESAVTPSEKKIDEFLEKL